jgi:hypothetical protein
MWSHANYRDRSTAMKVYDYIKDEKISILYNRNGNSPKGSDQDFLATYVWPIAKMNATMHDSFFCDSFGAQASPFPTQRLKYFCFVPCSYCCSESLHNKIWTDVCPPKCRPKEHQDWIYC